MTNLYHLIWVKDKLILMLDEHAENRGNNKTFSNTE